MKATDARRPRFAAGRCWLLPSSTWNAQCNQCSHQLNRMVLFQKAESLGTRLVAKNFPKKNYSSHHIESCDTCMKH